MWIFILIGVLLVLGLALVLAPKEAGGVIGVLAAIAGLFGVIIGLVVVLTIFRGIVLSDLWLWFMVPLGVKPIGTAWAIGISCLGGMFTLHTSKNKEEKPAMGLLSPIIGTLILWFVGWLIHTYWMVA